VKIDRLSLQAQGSIFHPVNKRETKTETTYRVPTAAELYALERNARLERSRLMGDLLAAGARALTTGLGRVVALNSVKETGHA
jgi:hypothetical protein